MSKKVASGKDKQTLGIWLDCYNFLRSSHFMIESYPDDDSSVPNVDAICYDSRSVRRIAVEHTRIQAFPGEKSDDRAALYQFSWTNPRPGVMIESIDMLYGPEGARYGTPALLALTAAEEAK